MKTKFSEVKVRILAKLKEIEAETFTTAEVANIFPHYRQNMPALLRELVDKGELIVVKKVKAPNNAMVNLHALRGYKPSKEIRRDRTYIANYKLNAEPINIDSAMDNWQKAWPDMFKLPAHLIRKPGQYNKIVHLQE